MANKRQRKKAEKKALGTFEGKQYRGGRPKGQPNLKKTASGELINMYGVKFTPDEKRYLETLANTANRKRKKMLKEEAALSDRNQQLQLMGKESDFILSRKHKSLHHFKDRKAFDTYIENLQRVNSKDYINERVGLYKRNHMKALENAYGDDAKDIIMKIRMMPRDQYMKMVQGNEDLEISYVYDPAARSGKLNQMRAALGMKLKEEEIE